MTAIRWLRRSAAFTQIAYVNKLRQLRLLVYFVRNTNAFKKKVFIPHLNKSPDIKKFIKNLQLVNKNLKTVLLIIIDKI